MKWLYLVIIWIFGIVFILSQPLESIPSVTFSYIWFTIVIVGSVNVLFNNHNYYKLQGTISSLIIGILIGVTIISINWSIGFPLIRDLFLALSPIVLFADNIRKLLTK